ncbi:NAD(P)/FAD-dependent oxidoreductase [Kocuria sabuli]|uniref:NAD(P)/FAD-dependent oxidoreductase n=1 Tax=Kocuria sabuli TaxID=3071448 RepID=UPI0034D7389E
MTTSPIHDVAIVGGGAAGLSAAVTLGRSLRSTVVVDAGAPRNAPADGAHNVLGREGISPLELYAIGRIEAEGYGAQFRRGRAVTARRLGDADGFEVELDDGAPVRARRLLLATGLVDELPEVPGVRELWGKSVLHCPYCHGWEVRGRRIAVLGTSPLSVHQALLFRRLSDDVTLLRHTMADPGEEAWEQLSALGVPVVDGVVARLRSPDESLQSVVFEDGRELPVDAVTVAPRYTARGELYVQLGGTLTDHPMGTYVATGPMGRTEVPGVWAAGNVSDLAAMVATANGAGVAAAAAVNADLVAEDARAAVDARAKRRLAAPGRRTG